MCDECDKPIAILPSPAFVSWLFSQAAVAAFSADHCSVGEPFAQLNVMPTAQPFWRNGKAMDACRFSRFGLTLRVLTADHGKALLMWFREAFLVRTSVSQAPETDSMVSAPASGVKWLASFARLNPDTSSWKTAQCSLLEEFTEFSQTWPSSGSMLSGECWERPMLELSTSEDESGFLPTPVTLDTGSRFNRSQSEGAQLRPTLGAMARFDLWPTPTAGDGRSSGSRNTPNSNSHYGISLTDAVRGDQGRGRMFPAPLARDYRSPNALPYSERRGGRKGEQLNNAMGGLLNPPWVEWLMGWPIGWTALQPLAMDRFREWQRQHGDCSSSE